MSANKNDTTTGNTGTRDITYDLISTVYHLLHRRRPHPRCRVMQQNYPHGCASSAGSGTRTRTAFRPIGFKPIVAAITPSRLTSPSRTAVAGRSGACDEDTSQSTILSGLSL